MRLTMLMIAICTMFTANQAVAQNPHFTNASASIQSSGNLKVSFKEAGLGNNQLVSFQATADATAVYACFNRGGNHPQATNKTTVSGPVSGFGTFSSGQNGQIKQSLTLSPPGPGSFSCPNGQNMVLASVSYSNVAIKDITNNVTEPIPGTYSLILVPGV
jgi:hypothetical protein